MARLLGMALRWTLLPFLVILVEAMAAEFWQAARQQGLGFTSLKHPLTLFLLAGIGFRVLFSTLMNRFGKEDPLEFIDTLEHELTHALVGYLTFSPPVSLSATLKSGGEVQLSGSNPLATLAPYFLPLWCSMILVLGFIARPGMQSTLDHGLFFFLGWYLYRLAKEYRWRQTDLHAYGFFFSTFFVILFLMLVCGSILKIRNLMSFHWIWISFWHAFQSIPRVWNWVLGHFGSRAISS